MDRGQFDTLARIVSTRQSRRAMLATLLGVLVLQHDPDPLAAKVLGARRGQGRQEGRGKHQHQHHGKGKGHGQGQPPCYPGTICLPGPGQDNSGCDFRGSTQFHQRDVRGADLSGANLTGAQLSEANLQGVDLGGACLVGANLLAATIDSSTNVKDAIFCHTLMPDGSVNDHDCGKGTDCCPTPEANCRTCEGAQCISAPNGVCSIFGFPCCPNKGFICGVTAAPFVTTCQSACDTDQECVDRFGEGVRCCSGQVLSCPFMPGARCCQIPGPLTC
jgi:hypothetical protein